VPYFNPILYKEKIWRISFLFSNKKDGFFIEKYGKVTVFIKFQEKIKRITGI